MGFKAFVFGVIVILIAVLYSQWYSNRSDFLDQQEQSIIDSWNISISEPKRKFKRIAVGINCNLDLIVSGTELLKALGHPSPGQSLDSVTIESLVDLTNTFTHYFSKGAAAERAFLSKDIYKRIIDTAEKLKSTEHYIGGNAALMAVKISELFPETKIQLVGPIGPSLSELLPSEISVPPNSIISRDEVHLIMEYGLGEKWGSLTAPVANRFITSYDESNSELTMLEQYFTNLKRFTPDLVLLGGLHLLENQRLSFVREKMRAVQQGLATVDPLVPIHLELASMANKECVQIILDEVLTSVSSLGLNEQELSFSSHAADGPHGNDYLTRTGQPEIHKISDMVLWMLQEYGYSNTNTKSRLTRIHFHSLTYHIVASVPGFWHNSESAVAAGTRMAGRQACNTKKLSPLDIELRIPQTFKLFTGDSERKFNENDPVLSWEKGGFHFVFSPVLVCNEPLKTVGLGDAISATGLMFSQFNPVYDV